MKPSSGDKLRRKSSKDYDRKGFSKISSYFQSNRLSSTVELHQTFNENEESSSKIMKESSKTFSSRSSVRSRSTVSYESDDSDIEIIGYESANPKESIDTKQDTETCQSQSNHKLHNGSWIKLSQKQKSEADADDATVSVCFTRSTARLHKRMSLKRKTSNSVEKKNLDNKSSESTEKSQKILLQGEDEEQNLSPLEHHTHLKSAANFKIASSLESPCRAHSLEDQIPPPSSNSNHQGNSNTQTESSRDQVELDLDIAQDASKTDAKAYRVPYYLQNFESILRTVLEDDNFSSLFDEKDHKVINNFSMLSDGGKRLYVRMFSRKLKWIPLNKLKYEEIADDLNPHLKELVDLQLIDCEDKLNDIQEVLGALPAGDIKALAKSYHITAKVTQKRNLVQELVKKTQQTSISSMFGNKGAGVAVAMMKNAKEKLKGIYKLRPDPRSVFVRVMMLFSVVNTTGDEDSSNGGQQQLFQMLMVNMGKVVYPTYEVKKSHNIFHEREDVIRFEQALQMEFDLLTSVEKGNWSAAYEGYKDVVEKVDLVEKDKDIVEWNTNLPDYLRCFTATSVLYRLLSVGIDIVQRRKDFEEAVKLLWKLLVQTTYCNTHRGYWWERLALNLDVHLKKSKQALEVVKKGLDDEHVKVGHRLALYQRAESICQRPHLKLQKQLQEFYHEPVREIPKVIIEGRVLHQGVTAAGPRFLTEGSYANGNAHDMTVCGVEEFVMDYYKKNGFPSSVHAEGSIVSSLFCLFFWDILFMSVPDAFHSPYQAMPLDLHTESFYLRRKEAIDIRIQELKGSSVEELWERIEETWTSHNGVMCAGMSWERIKSLEDIKYLVSCMGGKLLGGIVERYAKCPRHTRSGFPDLTLWNTQSKTFKICEVKGPGDKLSHKQILWINYLLQLGIDAEVCHVKAVAAKKLKAC